MTITITPIANGLYKLVFSSEILGHSNIYFTSFKVVESNFCTRITLEREELRVAEFFNASDILADVVVALREQRELEKWVS